MTDSVERFSSRVDNYSKYRPGYPPEIIGLLETECGLTPNSVIADVGSGTGKLAQLFLKSGNKVFGVEPNAGMRAFAESIFGGEPAFISTEGTAENSTLPAASVDLVTAGQAFHWFDYEKFRVECERILKPDGWVALVWNVRRLKSNAFLRDYEALLLKYGTDYKTVRHENSARFVEKFFAPSTHKMASFPNFQNFDLEGLRGRVFSSSYTPEADQHGYYSMVDDLGKLFETYQENGKVAIEYDTQIFYGQLSSK